MYHLEHTKTHCSVQYNVLLWYYSDCRIYCQYWRIYCRLYIPLPYCQVITPNKENTPIKALFVPFVIVEPIKIDDVGIVFLCSFDDDHHNNI